MADEAQHDEGTQEKKKGNPMFLFGVVGVLMLLEALGVYVLTTVMSPTATQAQTELETEADESEKTVEVLLVEDRFINISTGRVWQWQATIHVLVKNKHLERVQKDLEERSAEIKEGVAEIIAGAQDRHLREPARDTIKRQLTAYVNDVFGTDAEGEPRIVRVVISKWLPSPMDF